MKNTLATLLTAAALGLAATSAHAFTDDADRAPAPHFDVETTGSVGVHDGPFYESCPRSSASEGNANQQTRPVKQYGQTSGGYRC
ncbi:hypothetical protein [Methylobacterium segetis]|uniref:hypothetical protein n=1 Tax=Methylobacterium segetis TaxID=2488750 RepID=UPI00104A68F7|nr:hypothetical protein [Methylobacterium segetis]